MEDSDNNNCNNPLLDVYLSRRFDYDKWNDLSSDAFAGEFFFVFVFLSSCSES